MSKYKSHETYAGITTIAFVTFSVIFGLIGFYHGVDIGEAERADIAAKIHHENTAQNIQNSCDGHEGSALNECIENAIKTSGEYQRAERDLAAQKNMANYAKWLLAVTTVGTGITVVGIWFVMRSLEEAASANAIMRREQRPWVSLEKIILRKVTFDPYRNRINFKMAANAENFGIFPANKVHVKASMWEHLDSSDEAIASGNEFEKIGPSKDEFIMQDGKQIPLEMMAISIPPGKSKLIEVESSVSLPAPRNDGHSQVFITIGMIKTFYQTTDDGDWFKTESCISFRFPDDAPNPHSGFDYSNVNDLDGKGEIVIYLSKMS